MKSRASVVWVSVLLLVSGACADSATDSPDSYATAVAGATSQSDKPALIAEIVSLPEYPNTARSCGSVTGYVSSPWKLRLIRVTQGEFQLGPGSEFTLNVSCALDAPGIGDHVEFLIAPSDSRICSFDKPGPFCGSVR